MPYVKLLLEKLQFAFRVGKIVFDNYYNGNKAVCEIVDVYTDDMVPLAAHAQMYLQWIQNAEQYSIEYSDGKIIITLETK